MLKMPRQLYRLLLLFLLLILLSLSDNYYYDYLITIFLLFFIILIILLLIIRISIFLIIPANSIIVFFTLIYLLLLLLLLLIWLLLLLLLLFLFFSLVMDAEHGVVKYYLPWIKQSTYLTIPFDMCLWVSVCVSVCVLFCLSLLFLIFVFIFFCFKCLFNCYAFISILILLLLLFTTSYTIPNHFSTTLTRRGSDGEMLLKMTSPPESNESPQLHLFMMPRCSYKITLSPSVYHSVWQVEFVVFFCFCFVVLGFLLYKNNCLFIFL